jgi:poly-gamma-glutamate synthesis protein (capsule biosynthesis protein)
MESPSFPHLLVNASGQASENQQPSLLFAGDFYLRPDHLVQDRCDLFAPAMIELVQQSTFSVVNFEGTIPAENSQGICKEGPHLAFNHRAPALLRSAGFDGITLANNHAMDYGVEALQHTLQVCADCGLRHVGAGFHPEQAQQPLKVSLPGSVRLQILSFCEREFGVSTSKAAGTAWLTSPQAEEDVRQAKQESDLVVVCAHGGNELMPLPSAQRRQQLRRLIDAGADLVIGHHPHVPQGWEQYAGRYIFYSLGDFYFDSTDGMRYEYRDWGFMVRVFLEERRIKTLEIVPYERVRDKVVPLGSRRDAASHLLYLEQLSSILASSEFEGYWQQLAVNQLSAYRSFLRSQLAYSGISFRERLKETLRMSRDMWDLWRSTQATRARSSTDCSRSPIERQALGTLNVIRCESHRWVIETALAVLAGECGDLRSQKIRDELEAMDPFYGHANY